MIDLSNLKKITERKKKRVGRGKRGARGSKSGRGMKGSLKRGKMRPYFEGGSLPLTKKLPMLPGKGKNKPVSLKPVIINVGKLNQLRSGSVVNKEQLIKAGLIDKKEADRRGVKILGKGELKKKIKIKNIPLSAGARKKIEEAKGEIKE